MFKKIMAVIVGCAILLLGVGCAGNGGPFRSDSEVTVKDGVATYADGDLSFSWNTSEWYYTYEDEYPVLTRYWEGLEYLFVVMDCHSGMAEDLGEYAAGQMRNYFGDSVDVAKYTAVGPDATFADRDYAGVCTGVCDLTEEDGMLALVYGITDTARSAVLGVVIKGNSKKLEPLHEANYAGGRNNGVMALLADAVLSSFRFTGAAPV